MLSKEGKQELDGLKNMESESTQNLELLTDLDNLWKNSSDMTDYHQFDTEQQWSKFEQTVTQKATQSQYKQYATYAIAGLLLLSIAWFGSKYLTDQSSDEFRPMVYQSEQEKKEFKLNDHSIIALNAESQLSVLSDFTKVRDVSLTGQAYFDIERDEERPFEIHTPNEIVRVLGTSFDIKATDSIFDLHVTSGKVEVMTKSRTIEVTANKRLVKINGDYALVAITDESPMSWRTGLLIFENTALSKVVNTLEDHYKVTISNPKQISLSNCAIHTTFDNESLDEVFEELKLIANLEVIKTAQHSYQIQSVKCK